MQITRDALNKVMAGGGYSAQNWAPKRVIEKMKDLPSRFDEMEEKLEQTGDKDSVANLRGLQRAVSSKERIEVTGGKEVIVIEFGDAPATPAAATPPAEQATPAVAPTAAPGASAPEAAQTSAPVAAPPASGKPQKGVRPPQSAGNGPGDGVIGTITQILKEAGVSGVPVTKKQIGEKLLAKFPTRTLDAMMKTVQVQVPNRLKKDKGLDVQKNDHGYWIPQGSAPATTPAPVAAPTTPTIVTTAPAAPAV